MNALVTGGTKGIGRSVCQHLLEEGYNVSFCSRNQTDIDQVSTLWKSRYPNQEILGVRCDVSEKKEIENFAERVLGEFREIDALVNNAGIFMPGEIIDEEDGRLEEMMKVNLFSAYYLTRKIIPAMIGKGSGHIFNICSVASMIAYPNGGSYSISKFALLGFSKVLREELKTKGIRVTSILPGATWSDSWKGVDLPNDRLCQPEDVASAIICALNMSPAAVLEELIIRPQLGDL